MGRDRDGPLAGETDVRAYLSDPITVYDELFDVDSTPYREAWREGLVYDCSWRERLALLPIDLPHSLTLVWTESRYSGPTGVIGASPTRLSEAEAYATLASDLCHAYQHRLESPTWTHPYAREGFEQAASIHAIDQLAADYDHDALTRLAARQRAEAQLTGYIAHATRHGGITTEDIRALGVTEAELDDLQAHGRGGCSLTSARSRAGAGSPFSPSTSSTVRSCSRARPPVSRSRMPGPSTAITRGRR